MPMSLQEISDRMEIEHVMIEYAYCIDEFRIDDLDNVFTPDAIIDYSEMVGFKGNLAETKAFLKAALPELAAYQHAISTSRIKIDGDTATARTVCFNPMTAKLADGARQVFFVGLWYRDSFVRTPQGWRINHRYEEKNYVHNAPAGVMPE